MVFTVLKIMWQYQLLTHSEELWCGVRCCQISVMLLLAETTLWPVTNCCKFTQHINSPCVAVPQYNWREGDSIIELLCYTVNIFSHIQGLMTPCSYLYRNRRTGSLLLPIEPHSKIEPLLNHQLNHHLKWCGYHFIYLPMFRYM